MLLPQPLEPWVLLPQPLEQWVLLAQPLEQLSPRLLGRPLGRRSRQVRPPPVHPLPAQSTGAALGMSGGENRSVHASHEQLPKGSTCLTPGKLRGCVHWGTHTASWTCTRQPDSTGISAAPVMQAHTCWDGGIAAQFVGRLEGAQRLHEALRVGRGGIDSLRAGDRGRGATVLAEAIQASSPPGNLHRPVHRQFNLARSHSAARRHACGSTLPNLLPPLSIHRHQACLTRSVASFFSRASSSGGGSGALRRRCPRGS